MEGLRLVDTGCEQRECGTAAKLGHRVACPEGGCALLRALGESLPADPRQACPIDELAGADNTLVIRTLDELRQEMERHSMTTRALKARRTRDRRHAEALRRWP